MTMKQALTLVAALAALTGAVAAPQAFAEPPHHKPALVTAKPCTTTWEVTGRKVAVRRPAGNEGPVAKTTSPVHHYLHRDCPNRERSGLPQMRQDREYLAHRARRPGTSDLPEAGLTH